MMLCFVSINQSRQYIQFIPFRGVRRSAYKSLNARDCTTMIFFRSDWMNLHTGLDHRKPPRR